MQSNEEKFFDIVLSELGQNKFDVIKLLVDQFGLDGNEAMQIESKLPFKFKENVPNSEALKIKKLFENAGAVLKFYKAKPVEDVIITEDNQYEEKQAAVTKKQEDTDQEKVKTILKHLYIANYIYSCSKANYEAKERLDKDAQRLDIQIVDKGSEKINKHKKDSSAKYYMPEFYGPLGWILSIGIIGFLIFLVVFLFEIIFMQESWALSKYNFLNGLVLLGGCCGVVGLIYSIQMLIELFSYLSSKRYCKRANKDNIVYNQEVDKRYEEIILGLKKQRLKLGNRITEFQKNYMTANEAFYKFLKDSNVIYQSYHDIVPICQFIQYLESGRCSDLTGPHGCYNLYEQELRQNLIISNLMQIGKDIKTIQNNQVMMYKTLSSIDSKMGELVSIGAKINKNLEDISGNVEAIAGCVEVIQNNTSYTNSKLDSLSAQLHYYHYN